MWKGPYRIQIANLIDSSVGGVWLYNLQILSLMMLNNYKLDQEEDGCQFKSSVLIFHSIQKVDSDVLYEPAQ